MMSNLYKKILSLIFIVALAVPLCYTFFLLVKQKIVQHEMQERLEKEMLHTVTIQKQDIHWTKQGKELQIDNRMFDTQEVVYNEDGSITVIGLYDDEETKLIGKLNKSQQKQNATENQLLEQSLSLTFFLPEQLQHFAIFSFDINKKSNAFDDMSLPSSYLQNPTPPPRISIGNI